jgi:predicted phage-related endonuclease
MGLTAAQLDERRQYLGASDMSAVLGVNPWADEWDVLSTKRPDLVAPREAGDTRKADFGTRMEPVLRAWLADEIGQPVAPCSRTYRLESIVCMGANPDADVGPMRSPEEFAELKVSGILEGWGEPLTDNVPPHVFCQCQSQLACSPTTRRVHVVRCLPDGRDWTPTRYVVERDDETIGNLQQAAQTWWQRHVIEGWLPEVDPARPPFLDAVKRVRREEGAEVDVDYAAVVAPWEAKRKERLAAEHDEERLLAILLGTLGEARVGVCPEGRFVFALESAGKRIETERLKAEFPDVYLKVAKDSTRQMPRWRPAKKKD